MKNEGYENINASADKMEFGFISEGPKGKIRMMINIEKTEKENICNLSFGRLRKNGLIDDETINDNKDCRKILATVAIAIYEFSSMYPEKLIFFAGGTPSRNRLYRMAISTNLEILKDDFYVYGVVRKKRSLKKVVFKKDVNYLAFAVKRKRINFIK